VWQHFPEHEVVWAKNLFYKTFVFLHCNILEHPFIITSEILSAGLEYISVMRLKRQSKA